MNFNEALQKIGFSPLEATIYITLCKHGSLTGYEVAKLSGISRSNVYAALYSLQDKGMCSVSEGESTKYVALSKEELILSAKRNMSEILSEIDTHFPDRLDVSEPYVTIKGYDNVVKKVKNSILLCHSHLYILSTSAYIELFKEELLTISSSKKVTIICNKKLDLGPNVTIGTRNKSPQGFHMIIDTQSIITGDLKTEGSQCLYSNNQSLVRMMRESFITELDNITLTNH